MSEKDLDHRQRNACLEHADSGGVSHRVWGIVLELEEAQVLLPGYPDAFIEDVLIAADVH